MGDNFQLRVALKLRQSLAQWVRPIREQHGNLVCCRFDGARVAQVRHGRARVVLVCLAAHLTEQHDRNAQIHRHGLDAVDDDVQFAVSVFLSSTGHELKEVDEQHIQAVRAANLQRLAADVHQGQGALVVVDQVQLAQLVRRCGDRLPHIAVLGLCGKDAGQIKRTTGTRLGTINAANLRRAHGRLENGTVIGKLVLGGWDG